MAHRHVPRLCIDLVFISEAAGATHITRTRARSCTDALRTAPAPFGGACGNNKPPCQPSLGHQTRTRVEHPLPCSAPNRPAHHPSHALRRTTASLKCTKQQGLCVVLLCHFQLPRPASTRTHAHNIQARPATSSHSCLRLNTPALQSTRPTKPGARALHTAAA
jgi:hypothetical protein